MSDESYRELIENYFYRPYRAINATGIVLRNYKEHLEKGIVRATGTAIIRKENDGDCDRWKTELCFNLIIKKGKIMEVNYE